MGSTTGLSAELSTLINKGVLWRGEESSTAKGCAACPIERGQADAPSSFSSAANDTSPARQQHFLQQHFLQQHFLRHGLPLGAVHEWCIGQKADELNTAELNTADLNTADLNTADLNPADLNTADLNTADLNTADLNTPESASKPSARKRSVGIAPPFSIITAILRSTLSHQLQDRSGGDRSCAASASSDPRLVLWIGKNCWPTPYLLAQASQLGVNLLSRSLFIDPPDTKTKLWAIDAALRSSGVFGVVAQCPRLSTTMSRRFSLAAAHGGTIGFIVRPEKELSLPSAAMSRWRVCSVPNCGLSSSAVENNSQAPFPSHPRWEVELLKCKGSFIPPATLPVRWFVEVCDEISLSFPAELVSGSNQTKTIDHSEHEPKRQSA